MGSDALSVASHLFCCINHIASTKLLVIYLTSILYEEFCAKELKIVGENVTIKTKCSFILAVRRLSRYVQTFPHDAAIFKYQSHA
jgi:hypothetical protein